MPVDLCNRTAGHHISFHRNRQRPCWSHFSGVCPFPRTLCAPCPAAVWPISPQITPHEWFHFRFCLKFMSSDSSNVICIGFWTLGLIFLCWLSCCFGLGRIPFASIMLNKSRLVVKHYRSLHVIATWTVFIAMLWLAIWIFGVAGAVSLPYGGWYAALLVLSLAWSMEVLRNIVYVTVAGVVSTYYYEVHPTPRHLWCQKNHSTLVLVHSVNYALFVLFPLVLLKVHAWYWYYTCVKFRSLSRLSTIFRALKVYSYNGKCHLQYFVQGHVKIHSEMNCFDQFWCSWFFLLKCAHDTFVHF